jgi:hypothetical protein
MLGKYANRLVYFVLVSKPPIDLRIRTASTGPSRIVGEH